MDLPWDLGEWSWNVINGLEKPSFFGYFVKRG
jgi:hypothetical protein